MITSHAANPRYRTSPALDAARRLAFATSPCVRPSRGRPETALPPRAALTVLDTATGDRRTWTASGPSVVGEIVWAADGRTLGYTVGTVAGAQAPGTAERALTDGRITDVVLHALDTEARGNDLRTGRVLFREPADATLTSAVMRLDGRTGRGTLRRGDPPTLVVFDFDAGGGMDVIATHRLQPNVGLAIGRTGPPRHACLIGVDAFDRVGQGTFSPRGDLIGCRMAYAY